MDMSSMGAALSPADALMTTVPAFDMTRLISGEPLSMAESACIIAMFWSMMGG